MTHEEVQAQTGMPATCVDCHLGNDKEADKAKAHEGVLGLMVSMRKKVDIKKRSDLTGADAESVKQINDHGGFPGDRLAPRITDKNGKTVKNPDVRSFIYHDRNQATAAFNPEIAKKTCGKCHPQQFETFLKSPMGGGKGAHTQSQYVVWTGPAGPQSCGLWTGDLAQPAQDKFTDKNTNIFNKASSMPLTPEASAVNQKVCNQCHVGCLDCHFAPTNKEEGKPKEGVHKFIRKPDTFSCYGSGRTMMCHAGPLDRRRGDGYVRGNFAQPKWVKELKEKKDVHFVNKFVCVDCHVTNSETKLHGDQVRDPGVNTCAKCHKQQVEAYNKSRHKNVTCEACHTTAIGGYAFNFWAPGKTAGVDMPLDRNPDYYIDLDGGASPLLLKNPKDKKWHPYHVVPHISATIAEGEKIKTSGKIKFRNKPDVDIARSYYSNDAFAITADVKGDETDKRIMAWLNLDKVAHATGKSRTCESCHASTDQKIVIPFKWDGPPEQAYSDILNGSYTIVADKKGLRIDNIKGTGGGAPPNGLAQFVGKWNVPGNYTLPAIKKEKYEGKAAEKEVENIHGQRKK
ncbi:MAG: hypothetical protein HZC10_08095 [Nitrospirae bacterium]|nr:hypothetical protein [Nitrospirota bacterium]